MNVVYVGKCPGCGVEPAEFKDKDNDRAQCKKCGAKEEKSNLIKAVQV